MIDRPARLPARVVDALVVAAVGLVGLFGALGPVVLVGADPARVPTAGLVLAVVQAAVLWWRRDHPLAVLVAAVAALLAAQALSDPNAPSYVAVHAAVYTVAARTSRRRSLLALALLAAAGVADVGMAVWTPLARHGPVVLTAWGVLAVAAWTAGRYVAVRHAYLAALVAYSRQLERERDERARQAVRDERRRIARELHDQVAHHLGVVSLQTQAARRWLSRDAQRTAGALEAAEQAARAALATMPAILSALRTDDAPADLEPQPSLADLDRLVSAVAGDEVEVELRTSGQRGPLPAAVELAAYRVVQEALTNVVKHAAPAHVVVELSFARDRLEIVVADDGAGGGRSGDGTGGGATDGSAGLGLVGMRERVDLLGGVLTAGPTDGGFKVHAQLPLAPVSAPVAP